MTTTMEVQDYYPLATSHFRIHLPEGRWFDVEIRFPAGTLPTHMPAALRALARHIEGPEVQADTTDRSGT